MSKIQLKGSAMLNPVPAVLITSSNKDGKPNVFTVGWVGTACTKPPMLTVAIRKERLSYEYITETMEFTINLPPKKLTRAVDFCGVRSGKQVDKFKEMNLSASDGVTVCSPMIDECPVSIECKVKSITPLGSHDLFLAEVTAIHVDEGLMDDNSKIHLERADLICYSHGEYFSLNPKPLGKFGYSVQKKKKKATKS